MGQNIARLFQLFTFPLFHFILFVVQLKICKRCKRPFLASKEICPNCPAPYTWNQESLANVGCLLAMIAPIFLIIFVWLFFFFGIFFR
ncbi:MAG TPA: hypothetical protein VNB22_16245 [Pyrinomonadaceae bacterium]|nr:hypothetical protein [Pyrinomonadaceae bacterium]